MDSGKQRKKDKDYFCQELQGIKLIKIGLLKGRSQVSWKKVQTCLGFIFVHVDKSSILRAELTKTSRTSQNAKINYRRHLCNVADDASPVENRSADQNHILIAVFARELHDDVLQIS